MSTGPATFITILLSHYCEKARWALDRCGVPYREEPHVPLLSRLATRRGEGGTVPVLVSGEIRLTDSTAILVHADQFAGGGVLYPRELAMRRIVESFVKRFDEDLGPHVRRWAYSHLLPEKELLHDLWSRGAPKHEAFFLPLIVPIGRKLLRSSYRMTPESALRSLDAIHKVFREVGDRLGDGREFLAAGRFSAADLTFAALAAPVLFPAENRAVSPDLAQLPAPMREEVLSLRETDAGRFALRLYSRER
jgi:glutathione S-transferase